MTALVVFHHIPKTAGTSLRALLRRNYPPEAVVEIEGGKSREWWRNWYSELGDQQRRALKCVIAHGANKLFQTLTEAGVEFQAITMLRDPVELCVSTYYFTRELAELGGEDQGDRMGRILIERGWSAGDIFKNLGEGLVTSSELHGLMAGFFNGQTRLLLMPFGGLEMGYERGTKAFKQSETRARALDHYLVGAAERYEASIRYFAEKLGWALVEVERHNVTPSRQSAAPLDAETVELIRAYNAVDCELHAEMLARFE